ncbi:MAG: folate-binding protein YgfZ [SAR116 cluster bacterium]|nr:folate-binding protein YgfZ [SAR116 cluster bacterium]
MEVTGNTRFIARDDSRRLIRVSGADATDFLQSLITANVETLPGDTARASALLTPQGRVLVDFLISRTDDGFMIECDAEQAEELFTRLRRYRLRRPVDLAHETGLSVWILWETTTPPDNPPATLPATLPVGALRDSRHPDLGWRLLAPADATANAQGSDAEPASLDMWHAVRIAAAIPQGPVDLIPERALMLEAGLDRLGAVDFEKGCYVGQEVTARTHYRGLVKRRLAPFILADTAATPGAAITDDGKSLGTVLSTASTGTGNAGTGSICLAAMKLSDLHRLQAGDGSVQIDGAPAMLSLPDWMVPLPQLARTDSA